MISGEYIDAMIRAVRRSKTENTVEEITDLILEGHGAMTGGGRAQKKVSGGGGKKN